MKKHYHSARGPLIITALILSVLFSTCSLPPYDLDISLAVLSALEDQPTQSGILWRQALELDTYRTKRRFHHPRVQQIMGRSPELRAELARLREEIGPRRWYDRFL